MLFEDQLMLSAVDIERDNITGMRAALAEAESEHHVKYSSGKCKCSYTVRSMER